MEGRELKQFGDDIWVADGFDASVFGFRYPTRMAVIRLSNGDLFIWSPIAISDELRMSIDELGAVRHLIAPNSLHHLFLAEWMRSYPEALVYAPPGLRAKRGDINFNGDLGNEPESGWAGQVDQVMVSGNMITTEVVFFHRQSGTVLFTDLVQQFPVGWHSGWRAAVAKLDLMVEAEPTVPRKFRVAFTGRTAARAALKRILEWPAEKVLMAHGTSIHENGRAYIVRAFRWLAS